MNPDDPESAQRIVADYVQLLERTLESDDWPAALDALPYPKQTIKSAIQTSYGALTWSGQLTGELRDFLETAYVSLADFVSADVAQLMREYQRAGTALETDRRLVREKIAGPAWQTIAKSGTLAGGIARAIAEDAETLRAEFREFADSTLHC
ncbi:MAG: hypothetical protein DMF87_14060 [Acidobacteria bacterium]|nr:MAG: hypothetical protein DMF88_15665 [Acidobacteriota bacterium]PYR78494.1 MAG: hypothetical protein DMF87_14060 [Acidobacteriota bacterium]